jgi:hypothetical protein
MKTVCVLLYSTHMVSFSQQNLIVNGNCDSIIECPDNIDQLSRCFSWQPYSLFNTPDYLNSCSSNNFTSIPSDLGYQIPHSGEGYIHMVVAMNRSLTFNAFYNSIYDTTLQARESVIGSFNKPLENRQYQFECYVNFANKPSFEEQFYMAINSFDLKLLKEIENPLTCTSPQNDISSIIDINPSGVILDDTLNWVKLSVCFTAKGGEKYFAIGPMRDTNEISYQLFGTGITNNIPYVGYYFFDTFSLIQCDTCCGASVPPMEESMTIANSLGGGAKKPKITLNLQVNSTAQLELYDAAGRIVLTHGFTTEDKVFEIPAWLAFGMYHARVRSSNGFEDCKKLVLVE